MLQVLQVPRTTKSRWQWGQAGFTLWTAPTVTSGSEQYARAAEAGGDVGVAVLAGPRILWTAPRARIISGSEQDARTAGTGDDEVWVAVRAGRVHAELHVGRVGLEVRRAAGTSGSAARRLGGVLDDHDGVRGVTGRHLSNVRVGDEEESPCVLELELHRVEVHIALVQGGRLQLPRGRGGGGPTRGGGAGGGAAGGVAAGGGATDRCDGGGEQRQPLTSHVKQGEWPGEAA